MMASAKLVRECSSDLSSDVRSLSMSSTTTTETEEQGSVTSESEYTEEEKEYELDDMQILKTIGMFFYFIYSFGSCYGVPNKPIRKYR